RPPGRRPARAPHGRAGHRPRAGKPAPLSAAERRGQSAHRRLHPDGAGALRRADRARLCAVSPPQGPARAACRHALGRRAADVRHRPRADVGPEAPADGRAFRRARAAGRAAGVRARAPHPRRGADRAHRRAERAAGARGGRPRLPAGGRQHQAFGHVGRTQGQRFHPQELHGTIGVDIYLLEAIINGILLGGVLALLALGLNLIFGVIDVVWISYADIVMCGMYGIYFLYAQYNLPLPFACLIAILLVAALGAALHYIVIAPLLTAPPINQLLATGGVLF